MTNEIKEILDNPKILMLSYGNYISLDDYVKLKDYITNLQEELDNYKFPDCKSKKIEVVRLNLVDMMRKNKRLEQENERLKEIAEEHKNCTRKHWQQKCAEHCANEMLYKSRNEKAREMIRFIAYNSERPLTMTELNEVYNILGGDDNE